MNAIEIHNLTKRFGHTLAVNNLNMTVPAGAIYGFIGENGSGKSTTEKLISGLLMPDAGSISLYGCNYTDREVRAGLGVLIESPGCFPDMSVWENMQLQAANLNIKHPGAEIGRVLKLVHMEGAASNKYKNCSLGMKQRVGIAMSLLENPSLLILDEPINGLDADGMRIMREILTNLTQSGQCTVLISSHVLSELEKIATHYGIIRNGSMLSEMTAKELEDNCPSYVCVITDNKPRTKEILYRKFARIDEDEKGAVRIYDADEPGVVMSFLYDNGIIPQELYTSKISLEEYYTDLIQKKGVR